MRTTRLLALLPFAAAALALAGDPATPAADLPKSKQELKKELRKKLQQAKKAEELRQAEQAKKAADAEPVQVAAAVKPAVTQVAKPAPTADVAPVALARLIDEHVDRKLAGAKVVPSPAASDAEFLRRASLDLTGVIPTAARAKEFLDSSDPNKRAALIDELLASPNYGRQQADFWHARLFPRESANRFVLREPFVKWLEEQFNTNVPWSQFVTNMVTATGTVEANPAVTFFLANRSVDKLTDTVTQDFLGVQLQCAQCHNHPFTAWRQTEYWGMATFFSKVRPENPRNANKGGDNSKIGVTESGGRTKIKDFFPESAKTVPAKFLGGPEPKLKEADPYRPALAAWMTGPDNPFFARATVNRVWADLFGEGFVNPVDDMHDGNEPSHPELLAELARRFAAGGFDLKNLYRAVCLSRAYQRTSKPTAGNDAAEGLFAHMAVKVMTPEQLFDSLSQLAGAAAGPAGPRKGGDGQKKGSNAPRDRFVEFFLGGAEQANPVEYEAGIPQALRLMNSKQAGGLPLRSVVKPGATAADAVEQIYLATLSRRPTADEKARLLGYVGKAGAAGANDALADVLWAVTNSSEFTMVR